MIPSQRPPGGRRAGYRDHCALDLVLRVADRDGTNIAAVLSTGRYWTFVSKTYISQYTYARLVGCVLTDAGGNLRQLISLETSSCLTSRRLWRSPRRQRLQTSGRLR